MNGRNSKWLCDELSDLVEKGLVSQQQAEGIKQYYGQASEAGRKKTFVVILSIVGALMIGLGIISLIAHNWDTLSRIVRAMLSFAPVLAGFGLTGWALAKKETSAAFNEAATTFLTLMFGASMALVFQTYNISGDWQSFVLTWMLLCLPLVYIARTTVPGVLYCFGITAWSIGYVWDNTYLSMLYWPLMALVVPHFARILYRKDYAVRAGFMSFVLAVSFALFHGIFLVKTLPQIWMISIPVLFSSMYLAGVLSFSEVNAHWKTSFSRVGEFGLIIVFLILTNKHVWGDSFSFGEGNGLYATAGYTIILILLSAVILMLLQTLNRGMTEKLVLGCGAVAAVLAYALNPAGMIIMNAYFLVLSLDRVHRGVKENKLRVINEGLILLTLLIALRFFDSELDMVLKGLVLILMGAGFLAVNIIFLKHKGVGRE